MMMHRIELTVTFNNSNTNITQSDSRKTLKAEIYVFWNLTLPTVSHIYPYPELLTIHNLILRQIEHDVYIVAQ